MAKTLFTETLPATTVTDDFMNSIFGTGAAGGHKHDGVDDDGHADKIDLSTETKGILPLSKVEGGGSAASVRDAVRGLFIKNNVSNANNVDINADEVVFGDAAGTTIKRQGIALTLQSGTGGAGGLDAGVITDNRWYHFWLCGRVGDNVVSGVLSLFPTDPTLPVGYTHKAYVGAMFRVGTMFRSFFQVGNRVWLDHVVGIVTNQNAGAPVAAPLSTVVPVTAKMLYGNIGARAEASGLRGTRLAPTNSVEAGGLLDGPVIFEQYMNLAGQAYCFAYMPFQVGMKVPQRLYWQTGVGAPGVLVAGGAFVHCSGWEY